MYERLVGATADANACGQTNVCECPARLCECRAVVAQMLDLLSRPSASMCEAGVLVEDRLDGDIAQHMSEGFTAMIQAVRVEGGGAIGAAHAARGGRPSSWD